MKPKFNLSLGIAAVTLATVGSTMFANADALTRQLQMGMTGTDVGTLQSFLAKNPNVYPEGKITNYFWTLTKNAVVRFQALNGIATVGRVGPQTLGVINAQMSGTTISTGSTVPPVTVASVVNNGNGNVTINWNTPVPSVGTIYYSTTPLNTYENDNSVTISGSTISANNYQNSQSIQIPNVQSGVTYYYTVYTTGQNGIVNMTWPATFRF